MPLCAYFPVWIRTNVKCCQVTGCKTAGSRMYIWAFSVLQTSRRLTLVCMTAPFVETAPDATQSVTMRLPRSLLEAADLRAESVKMTRTAWTAAALTWVLANLPTGLAHPERDEVATRAPREVTGDRRLLPGAPVKEHGPDRDGVVADLGPAGF